MSLAEIHNLSIREKIQILEAIWEDLNERVDQMAVSPEQQKLLDSRIERIRSGVVEIHDWDTVKHSLGKK